MLSQSLCYPLLYVMPDIIFYKSYSLSIYNTLHILICLLQNSDSTQSNYQILGNIECCQQNIYLNMEETINANSLDELTNILVTKTQFKAIGANPIEELQLQTRDYNDLQQIKYILTQILSYPSTELAQLHQKSNKLGSLDLKDQHQNKLSQQQMKELGKQSQFCPCCGFIKQQNSIKLCTSIKNLNNIGLSTYLYFQTLINLIILLTIAFIVYCIYSIATNIVASHQYKINYLDEIKEGDLPDLEKYRSFEGLLTLSLGSKQLNSSDQDRLLFTIQCWIGVAMVVIWGCFFINIKKRQKLGSLNLLQETKSAADFSIVINNVPTDMTEGKLQEQLNAYIEQITDLPEDLRPKLKIVKFNMAKPFYLDENKFKDEKLMELNERYQELKQMFIQWIEYRMDNEQFEVEKSVREQFYQQFQQLIQQRVQIFMEITEQIKKQIQQNQKQPTTVTFITFQSSKQKNILLELNEEDFSDKLRYYLTCCSGRRHFYLTDSDGNQVKAYIKQAPEPEDIIWNNLGQDKWQLRKKKFYTFLATVFILMISFAVVFGLSKAQIDYATSAKSNSYMSFFISLVISIFNVIIQQLLRRLTLMQRNYTTTIQQASLGIKAVLALLINSILIPILVNYYFKEGNLYGINGLAYDVFLLGVTNSYLSPFIKFFDLYYVFTRLIRWLYGQPSRKLWVDQKQLNMCYEYIQFQAGYQYIYMVNLFLFTCFFMPLQPIIVIFAITGLGLMFWAQKYSLYNRCRRPVPGNKAINTTMYTLIYLGPVFFGIGSFCWSHFFQHQFIGIAPNLTICVVAFIIFILPYRWLVHLRLDEEDYEDMSYQQNRIFLPSEYDRLNPSTSEQAVKQYIQFVEDFKKGMGNKSKEEIQRIQKGLLQQANRGRFNQQNPFEALMGNLMGSGKTAHEDANILSSLIGTNNNVNNPLFLANSLTGKGNMNELNVFVQNWGDSQNPDPNQTNPLLKITQSNLKKQQRQPVSLNLFGENPPIENSQQPPPFPQNQGFGFPMRQMQHPQMNPFQPFGMQRYPMQGPNQFNQMPQMNQHFNPYNPYYR